MIRRVGLNATCFDARPSGANQRFLKIYGALIHQRQDIDFVVYEPADHRVSDWFGDAPNVVARRTPLLSGRRLERMYAGLWYWKKQLAADRLDLFEMFNLPLIKADECPTVLTIHDLRALQHPSSTLNRLTARAVMRHAFSRADRVIAVSQAINDEIRAFWPTTTVTTVYNGVDPSDFSPPDLSSVLDVRTRYSLPDRFVLAVGHLEHRKNYDLLMDAIALLRNMGIPKKLVIVGNNGGAQESIRNQIKTLSLDDSVILIERADNHTVRVLYAECELLVFPSRYEGFGIPILEAMASGKAMVLSDTPVFRELTLSQYSYFNVDDAHAAASAIDNLAADPKERERQSLFGKRRVLDFNFNALAFQISSVYDEFCR